MKKIILSLCVVVASGCSTYRPVPNAKVTLDHVFTKYSSLRFSSWGGGQPQGFDTDTWVTLYANGTAELTELGYAVEVYAGTFAITNKNEIVLRLENYTNWPIMVLAHENKQHLFLLNKSGSTAFIPGKRTGFGFPSGDDPNKFWPFALTGVTLIKDPNKAKQATSQ